MAFSTVQEAIDSIGRLGMAVVVDDEDRENEGDLVMAAEAATPENIAFFLTHTSGFDRVPLLPSGPTSWTCPSWRRPTPRPSARPSPSARTIGTARPRGSPPPTAHSIIAALIDLEHAPNRPEPARPHLPAGDPAPAVSSERAGHTEAMVDLSLLLGRPWPARWARPRPRTSPRWPAWSDLERFAKKHDLPSDLHCGPHPLPAAEREARAPRALKRASWCRAGNSVPSSTSRCWTTSSTCAWSWATWPGRTDVLVRVHSECLTGDASGSLRCAAAPSCRCCSTSSSGKGGAC